MQAKKKTRNQVASEAKKAMAHAQAQSQMQAVAFSVYRNAVTQYFGKDLPAEMVTTLETEMRAAVEQASAKQENLDLLPLITRVVREFKAGDERVAADAAYREAEATKEAQ